MNSAEFSSRFFSKSQSSSKMSVELVFPREMFIKQQSDFVNSDTNQIDSNNLLQNLKQTTEEIVSFDAANSGDQFHKCQKVVFKNKKKLTEKLPSEPKNAGKLRSSVIYSQYQIDALNLEYQKNKKYITIPQKKEIARELNLSENQVKNWFQNKRSKEKRDEKKKFTLKKKLPPITTFSSISHKDIRENFYSLCWNEEKSLGNEAPSERAGSLPQSIIPSTTSQDASTLFLPYCPEKTVPSNNFHLNISNSLPHSSSGDTASLSLQVAHEENSNINSSWYQNDFLLNMPLPSPHVVSSDTTSLLSLRSSDNNVSSVPRVMQQALVNPGSQYFNQWIYPFYSYWPQNQQFNIKQEIPDDFDVNLHCQNNVQLLNNNYSQRFDHQQNFDQPVQFPLDFINSYNLGNHFLNM